MNVSHLLSQKEVTTIATGLSGWRLEEGRLQRNFTFKNFIDAWSFMSEVALIAQSMNHHPDWFNSYNRVSIALTTHEVGGVTAQDVEMARQIERLLER